MIEFFSSMRSEQVENYKATSTELAEFARNAKEMFDQGHDESDLKKDMR